MAPICGVFLGLFFAGCMVSEPPIPPREALAEAANRIEDILLDETPGGPATPIMDGGERPEDPTRVSVWLYNDPVVSPVAADPRRRAALNRKHPNVTLDCQLAGPWMMAVQKLTVNLAAGDAGDLPDIALVKRFWLPRLARTGRLVPMDVLLPKSLLEDVREPSRAAFTVDGLLYAMPGEGFCNVLLYNKELLPAGPPATWDALRCTAKAMPRTKQDFYPIGDVPFLESLWSAGGAVYEDRQCDLRAPEASEALEFILGLRNSGLAHPAAIGDPERGRQLFFSQKVGMTVVSSRYLAQANASPFTVGVAPIPGKSGPISSLGENALVVFAHNAEAKRPAIVAVLDFLTGPETQGKPAAQAGSVPVRKSIADTVAVSPGLASAYQSARHTPPIPAWPSIEFELYRWLDRAYRWRPEAS